MLNHSAEVENSSSYGSKMVDSLSDKTDQTPFCMDFGSVFIALMLLILIFLTVFGNILIVLSVVVYKRMRTFTNILLVSLASADLLVATLVTPLAMIDLLRGHNWVFGRLLCKIWTTVDVLLCTASILNLCVISLDRYFAITSPLRYTRTRSSRLAGGLLAAVWLTSMVICSPPWFISAWKHFENVPLNSTEPLSCQYTSSLSYRIYSAMGSFYIPLFVMLFVYYKIFRVASSREQALNQAAKSGNNRASGMRMWHRGGGGAGTKKPGAYSPALNHSNSPGKAGKNTKIRMHVADRGNLYRRCTTESLGAISLAKDTAEAVSDSSAGVPKTRKFVRSAATVNEFDNIIVDPPTDELPGPSDVVQLNLRNGDKSPMREDGNDVPLLAAEASKWYNKTMPNFLIRQAGMYYQEARAPVRGSRERMVYLKERKALKTIGLVVSGFIICWLPFFILYLMQAVLTEEQQNSKALLIFADIFLWLGYSNSVLNPIIYTFYNRDFRRCFRDLVMCGCFERGVNRRQSVKRLHQHTQL